MANVIFGSPVYSDVGVLYTPTFADGSWSGALPLTNLQDSRLHYPARSTNALAASTWFTADLKTDRPVRVLALPKHTISEAGTVRVRGMSALPRDDALDFGVTGWSAVGTPVRTAAAFISDDGVPLDLIEDDSAVAVEGYQRDITFSGDGAKVQAFRVKAQSAASCRINILDVTATASRLAVTITWAAGVPSLNVTAGTHLSTTLLGNGVYRIVIRTATVTAANTNRLIVQPATDVPQTVTNVGSTYFGDFTAWNGSNDALVYDTGCKPALPTGTTLEDRQGLNCAWWHVAPTTQTARYWRVNVSDPTNAAGYIDISRLIIAGGFQPTINVELGCAIGIEDDSSSVITDGGAAIHHARSRRRTATGVLAEMPDADQLTWRKLQKTLGKTGQLFFVLDPDDTTLAHERAFLGVMSDLNAIEYPTYARSRSAFAIREEL